MYKLTFENSDDSHALYAADVEVLYDYLHRSGLKATAYTIVNVEYFAERGIDNAVE